MFTVNELEKLLAEAPAEAIIRVVAGGASTFFKKKGAQFSTTIDTGYVQVRGTVGPTPNVLSPGALIIRSDRVDFIEVTLPS
jgi:hypothetical protein